MLTKIGDNRWVSLRKIATVRITRDRFGYSGSIGFQRHVMSRITPYFQTEEEVHAYLRTLLRIFDGEYIYWFHSWLSDWQGDW